MVVFHIRASYRLRSLSFHDNRASHSRDTIWPWKFKVKGKCQKYPSQGSVLLTHFLSVSHQGVLSTPVPFVLWQSGLPFPRYNLTLKIKVKGQGQRHPSQRSIQLTHFLSVSHQRILSTPVPFVPWQSGLPFPRYNLTLKNSRSEVKVKGQGYPIVSVASSWLNSFFFYINWTNHSYDMANRMFWVILKIGSHFLSDAVNW